VSNQRPDKLEFNATASPEKNIEAFYAFLKSGDERLAEILESCVEGMFPLKDASKRTSQREACNAEILKKLDLLPE